MEEQYRNVEILTHSTKPHIAEATVENSLSTGLLFIDVDAKTPVVVKEEPSSPDEKLSEVKQQQKIKLSCSECATYSTYIPERMTRHIRKVHRGENPFQCFVCEYSTYNSARFREHVDIHQGRKPYTCKHCPYRSVSKKYIKMHEARHKVCDKCGFVARNRQALKRHKRQNGCGGVVDDDEDKKTYNCDACNLSYNNSKSLSQHKKLHKACEVCGKEFSHLVLAAHMKKEHGNVETKIKKPNLFYKFECSACPWVSNCRQKILLHMIHHPSQQLDGNIDVTPLVNAGILTKC